jgi:hypothetical protein
MGHSTRQSFISNTPHHRLTRSQTKVQVTIPKHHDKQKYANTSCSTISRETNNNHTIQHDPPPIIHSRAAYHKNITPNNTTSETAASTRLHDSHYKQRVDHENKSIDTKECKSRQGINQSKIDQYLQDTKHSSTNKRKDHKRRIPLQHELADNKTYKISKRRCKKQYSTGNPKYTKNKRGDDDAIKTYQVELNNKRRVFTDRIDKHLQEYALEKQRLLRLYKRHVKEAKKDYKKILEREQVQFKNEMKQVANSLGLRIVQESISNALPSVRRIHTRLYSKMQQEQQMQ